MPSCKMDMTGYCPECPTGTTCKAVAAMFTLRNDPPKKKPWRAESNRAIQRVLLTGMDCLPDQQDLFDA